MTLRYIEIFLALARTPNMREVASRLYISQAGVSSALRELESELGVLLFDRVSRGIRINEKGRFLANRLAPLYRQLYDSLSLTAADEMVGELHLGASTTLANQILPPILYDFKKQHSLVNISLKSASTKNIVQQVEDGELDMGFVEGDVHSLKVQTTPLSEERLVVVTSDRELAQGGPYPIAELMDENWLLRQDGSGTRETFLTYISRLGLSPKVFLEFSNNDAIKSVLRNKGTLACISPLVVATELKHGELFEVPVSDVVFSRTFMRVLHVERSLTPLLEQFSHALKSQLLKTKPHEKNPAGNDSED